MAASGHNTEGQDTGPTRSAPSLKSALWVWSYAWTVGLFETMEVNMIAALMPSMIVDLRIAIVSMGAILGGQKLMRMPAAWVAGYFGDRLGRVAWLRWTAILFIAATILLSLSWDFWSFVIFSFFAEFAFYVRGGLAMILVAEHAPAKHRGWLVGLTNPFAIGATVGPLLGSWAIASGLGWRFPFMFLALPAAISSIQSFFVKEPERFLELKKVRQTLKRGGTLSEADLKYGMDLKQVEHSSIRQLFAKDLRRRAILYALYASCSAIFWSNGSSYWTLFFPAEKGLTYIESLTIFGLLWAIAEPGFLVGSFLSQVTGRNQMMRLGYGLATVGSFIMVQFAYGFQQILLTSAMMMFGAGLVYGTNPAYSTEVFPTRVRAIVTAWTGTVSSIVQLITLPVMAILAGLFGWGLVYQLFITSAAFLSVVLLFFLPKPNPKAELEEISK